MDYRASYEDLLDEDKHKANLKRRREPNAGTRWLHLGSSRWAKIPTSLLGPKLTKRFKGGRVMSEPSSESGIVG